MANYDRDTGEEYIAAGNAVKYGSILAGIAGLAGLVLNAAHTASEVEKNSQRQYYQNQMAECDRRINELSSGLLGSWLNSDQIEAEKKKRAELQKEYDKI